MLTLRGAPALSAFRLDKLSHKLSAVHPHIKLLHTEFVHFADLADTLQPGRRQVLEQLLEYGPTIDEAGHVAEGIAGQMLLVTPRPGTISPWSSKATDIARNCGLSEVKRIERGVAYQLALPENLSQAQLMAVKALLHYRMTESEFDALDLSLIHI